jgi:light-harvesting complex I chlorophyll a/b binding protein 1
MAFHSSDAFVTKAPLTSVQKAGTTSSTSPLKMASDYTEGERYTSQLVGAPTEWPWPNEGDRTAGLGFGSTTEYFDPLGLTKGAKPSDIKKWRESELKHGRIAMLGFVGVIVQEVFHPFFFGNQDPGPAIYHFQQINSNYPVFGYAAVFAIGVIEAYTISRGWAKGDPQWGVGATTPAPLEKEYLPGDLGFDPLNLAPADKDSEDWKNLRRKEINNGRLGMIGFAGLIAQELVDHKGIVEHYLSNRADQIVEAGNTAATQIQ